MLFKGCGTKYAESISQKKRKSHVHAIFVLFFTFFYSITICRKYNTLQSRKEEILLAIAGQIIGHL